MFHAAEVIETKKAYKPNQKDDDGMPLFNGSILVRVGGGETALGQVRNFWCAPATFNRRIPLIGEQVLIFEAPGTEQSAVTYKTTRYYYFVPYNTVNDVTSHQFPTLWNRTGGGEKSKPAASILADKNEVGYTINKKSRGVKMLQPFEGDDIWEGRHGQSIRFTRSYKTVNSPGVGIYQQNANNYYPGNREYDPLMILKVKKPKQGTDYDIENLSTDTTSIYLTTSQKLLKFVAGPKTTVCDVKEIPNWDKGGQVLIDSDRVVINAKNDSAFLLGKNKSIISAKSVILRSAKYHVELDDLMKWLKSLAKQIHNLVTAQATFTTFMGPTGVASNSAQITKIVNADWKLYFEKTGCGGGIGSRDIGNANSIKGKIAANSLVSNASKNISSAVNNVFSGGAPPSTPSPPPPTIPLPVQPLNQLVPPPPSIPSPSLPGVKSTGLSPAAAAASSELAKEIIKQSGKNKPLLKLIADSLENTAKEMLDTQINNLSSEARNQLNRQVDKLTKKLNDALGPKAAAFLAPLINSLNSELKGEINEGVKYVVKEIKDEINDTP